MNSPFRVSVITDELTQDFGRALEIEGSDLERTTEILRELVGDDRNSERRVHMAYPSFSWRYLLLRIAESFGVPALSGTLSSSTIAQPRKPTWWSALNIPGRSTWPRPSSTKRYERFASAASDDGDRSTSLRCRNSSRSW